MCRVIARDQVVASTELHYARQKGWKKTFIEPEIVIGAVCLFVVHPKRQAN